MSIQNSIFLVGPMGAGKTTVGKLLAKNLNKKFVDSDQIIEHRTGVNIPLIFDMEGEEGFRVREKAVIEELSQQDDIVVATGGGAVVDPASRQIMMGRSSVVYLYAPVDQLIQRLRKDVNRPLLQTDDPRAALEQLMLQREAFYQQVATFSVDTSQYNLRRLVDYLIEEITKFWAK